MANTTYVSKLNPQFQNAGVQDVSANLHPIKAGMQMLIQENEKELKALRNIAQDQSQIDFNRGAAELVKQFGTDYKGLNDAMMGLENNLYQQVKGEYPDIAENLLRQYDLARLRAVEQARKDNLRVQNEKIRKTSDIMLDGLEAAATDDYLIYLGEISTKKPEERKPQNITPFLEDLKQHNAILERKDVDGNPIYTDTQISSRKGMKGVRMEAAYRMINGMTLDQLKNFYNTKFQSERWAKEAGFNMDDIHKLETRAKSRITELQNDEKHEIQVRAIQDTASLINNGTDMETIERVKKMGVVPDKFVDDVVEASNKYIIENWYDPNITSDPLGTLKLYAQLGELYKDSDDDSPEAMVNRIQGFVKLADNIGLHQKELNMPNKEYESFYDDVKRTIIDKEFRKNISEIDVAGLSQESLPTQLQGVRGSDTLLDAYKYVKGKVIRGKTGLGPEARAAKVDAAQYVQSELPNIMSHLRNNDKEGAISLANSVLYNRNKKENAYWIAPETMDKLEAQFQQGKKPLFSKDGAVLEYQGGTNSTLFKTKLF